VVDDGSADRTYEVATAFSGRGVRVLRQEANRGKGAAVKLGVMASRGRRVLLSDADFSTPITELPKLEAKLGDVEVAIGSRSVAGADVRVHQPLYRELMGKTFNKLIRLAGVGGLADTQCGFKLFAGDVAREVFAEVTTPGFAFDVEVIWLARRRGYRVAEVGVVWVDSPASRVRPLVDPPRMILEIVRFRWRHRRA
jgi:dolichyl-phosphate beta-glucosyltransferase